MENNSISIIATFNFHLGQVDFINEHELVIEERELQNILLSLI